MNGFSKSRIISVLAAGLGASLLAPLAANASEAGDRNTTYALGAAAAALAADHKWVPAAAAAVGAAVAGNNWQKDINRRHDQYGYGTAYGYNNGAGYGGYSAYPSGGQPTIVVQNRGGAYNPGYTNNPYQGYNDGQGYSPYQGTQYGGSTPTVIVQNRTDGYGSENGYGEDRRDGHDYTNNQAYRNGRGSRNGQAYGHADEVNVRGARDRRHGQDAQSYPAQGNNGRWGSQHNQANRGHDNDGDQR